MLRESAWELQAAEVREPKEKSGSRDWKCWAPGYRIVHRMSLPWSRRLWKPFQGLPGIWFHAESLKVSILVWIMALRHPCSWPHGECLWLPSSSCRSSGSSCLWGSLSGALLSCELCQIAVKPGEQAGRKPAHVSLEDSSDVTWNISFLMNSVSDGEYSLQNIPAGSAWDIMREPI